MTPARVKLRRKSSFGVSCSVRSSRSVTCLSVSSTVAPGPGGLHHHRLDDEGRVLVAAESAKAEESADHRDDHQVDGERAVLERPFRKIEARSLAPTRAGGPSGPGAGPARPR